MRVAEHAGDAPFAVGAEHPHHRKAGLADELPLAFSTPFFVELVIADLHRAPAGDGVDVERALDQLSALAETGRIRELRAPFFELADEIRGFADVETPLVVIEFDVVGDHRTKARGVARPFEEELEQSGVRITNLLSQLRLRRDRDGRRGRDDGDEEGEHGVLVR
jgi:hypothetical protein